MAIHSGRDNGSCLTLAALAEAKRLPIDFLRSAAVGLCDLPNGGVGIPYFGPTGEAIAVKRRTALRAKDGSYWPKGRPLAAYGQWRVDEARKAGFLISVEGESDCWACWYHHFPPLGIPGANAVKTLERQHIEAIDKVYIHCEPDSGGATFVAGMLDRLAALGFDGEVFELRMPDGTKDPADLHAADPQKFRERLEETIRHATPLELSRASQCGEKPGAVPLFADPIPASQLAPGGASADWLWHGYLARGSVTLLTSLWKSGKSTLLSHLVNEMGRGNDLAGLRVSPGNVLVVSEESAALWAGRRDKLGIGDHAFFYIRPFLGRPDPAGWNDFIRHIAEWHFLKF